MKIFISYSTKDLPLAQRVFGDVVAAGAAAFQYGQTEVIGEPSWEQVVNWINESDVFIVLVSQSALQSKPVKEEIAQAHHSYINRGRPGKIVAAIVEPRAIPPPVIERFARVDLVDYDRGMGRLMVQLGLQRRSEASRSAEPPTPSLPDLGPVFSAFKKRNPAPTPAAQFAKETEKLVARFDAIKLENLPEQQRARKIDKILAELAGNPPTSAKPTFDQSFLDFLPLEAPTLTVSLFGGATWTAVKDATGYALEGSSTENFESSEELYRGPEVRFDTTPWPPPYLRVKALGGFLTLDSPWSQVVDNRFWGGSFRIPLEAPILTVSPLAGATWTAVKDATGYALEGSSTENFESSEELYRGPEVRFDTTPWPPPYLRVKALGGFLTLDSPWSQVVDNRFWGGSFRIPLEAPILTVSPLAGATWTAVKDATGYALEGSSIENFESSTELYRGPEVRFDTTPWPPPYLRVKALGGFLTLDSPWSQVVNRSLKFPAAPPAFDR